MTKDTGGASGATLSASAGGLRVSWHPSLAGFEPLPDLGPIEALAVPTIAESAEAVVEGLDAPLAAMPVLAEGPDSQPSADVSDETAISIDEYAKAVLYNGLGHYQAARVAGLRACVQDDFALLEGALAELVEASVRSGGRGCAADALSRLEACARVSGSDWAIGMASGSRALLCDDLLAEDSYLDAIRHLSAPGTRVALARVQLLYGEWLRRQGRRVDAREQLTLARSTFKEVGLVGFAERASRELLATGRVARKRTDDTRFELTPQEGQIAQLAARGSTNPQIGQRLFISPRTVEWHLRKVFAKLGVSSRRELNAALPHALDLVAPA